jgi:DNA-binding transcriptional MerR regulator/GGDEF domain-containing protein
VSDQQIVQSIQEHLQQPTVQSRLYERLGEVRDKLTLSIGTVSDIVGVSGVQLRYWETLGILSPGRTRYASVTSHPGQRRYGLDDLAKLVVIDELHNRASYTLSDIAGFLGKEQALAKATTIDAPLAWINEPERVQGVEEMISQAEGTIFWNFFLPRVIYHAMLLIFEQTLNFDFRLFLPFGEADGSLEQPEIKSPEDLYKLGEVLLCWHGRDRPLGLFLVKNPVLEFPERYTLLALKSILPSNGDDRPLVGYLAIEKKYVDLLNLSSMNGSLNARHAAKRILAFCQNNAALWQDALTASHNTLLYLSSESADALLEEHFLKELAEVVVRLGGLDRNTREELWRFCCILQPTDPPAPLMQSRLEVRGKSPKSPHRIGTTISPSHKHGLCLLAYMTGTSVRRNNITDMDSSIALREREGNIRSAIAVPVGKLGRWLGVLYVASDEPEAFSAESQLVLRVIVDVLCEWITSDLARTTTREELTEMIEKPDVVDLLFKEFLTSNDFLSDLEQLLRQIAQGNENAFGEHLSLIAVDVDNLSRFAHTYGDQAAKNGILAVGRRIKDQMNILFSHPRSVTLYRAYGDRFYLLLRGVPLEQAREYSEQLKTALNAKSYRIDLTRFSLEQPTLPDFMRDFELTTRLGVTGYSYSTLRRYLALNATPGSLPSEATTDWPVLILRDRLARALEDSLGLTKDAGGQVVKDLIIDAQRIMLTVHTQEEKPSERAKDYLILANLWREYAVTIDGDKAMQCNALESALKYVEQTLQVADKHHHPNIYREAVELRQKIQKTAELSGCARKENPDQIPSKQEEGG